MSADAARCLKRADEFGSCRRDAIRPATGEKAFFVLMLVISWLVCVVQPGLNVKHIPGEIILTNTGCVAFIIVFLYFVKTPA